MLWLGKLYVWKWQISTINKHFSGGIVGKWQKFRPFSNNLLRLFENGRKQTINHLVGILLENGRNFCRFLTTTTSCLKTAENKPSTILWGLCWKTAEISAVFQQLVFGRFPTTQNVSAVFQQRGFDRFPTIFFGRFPHPPNNKYDKNQAASIKPLYVACPSLRWRVGSFPPSVFAPIFL